jgi:hypothetical protein
MDSSDITCAPETVKAILTLKAIFKNMLFPIHVTDVELWKCKNMLNQDKSLKKKSIT